MPVPPAPLSGPSVAPASGGPAAQLVVLLHGVGVDGSDLIALAPLLAEMFPDAAFVAPNGPEPFDLAPFGRQWFSLADRSPPALGAAISAAAPALDAYIDAQIAAWGVGAGDVALVGFSQGAMMALEVGLRRATPPAALVGLSGALVDDGRLATEIRARPPVLLVHGAEDEVVNPACLDSAEATLGRLGVPVLAHRLDGLGHEIDDRVARLLLGFLGQVFGVIA